MPAAGGTAHKKQNYGEEGGGESLLGITLIILPHGRFLLNRSPYSVPQGSFLWVDIGSLLQIQDEAIMLLSANRPAK